jgi:CelD/BcsL family acetyltransferase involved in cellulose biosynthesis
MANDPRKAAFLTPPMRAHMRATVLAAAEGGWLQLALLWVGDARAAVSINFEHARRVWVYNSGMDPRFAAISPGRVLLGEVLRHAHDHGLSHLDFLRGDEAYKVQLGAVPRFIARATVTR